MAAVKDLKILVAGTVPSAIKFIEAQFKKAGCRTTRVMKSVDIFSKIDEVNPDVVVIDIQMEEVSTYEVIEKVKAMDKPRVSLALYSFFVDKEMAKESILHRLFASQTKHPSKETRRPIKYLGMFSENTFDHKISLYLESLKEE